MTIYLNFVEVGSSLVSSAGLVSLSGAGFNAPWLALFASGAAAPYAVKHTTTVSDVSSALGATPAVGDTVELVAWLNADGSVQIGQALNGAVATTSGVPGVLALASAWSAARLYVGSLGSTVTGGTRFIDAIGTAGSFTLAEMQAVPGPA
jgi:hypothetical protein